jgi:hypothetical protein
VEAPRFYEGRSVDGSPSHQPATHRRLTVRYVAQELLLLAVVQNVLLVFLIVSYSPFTLLFFSLSDPGVDVNPRDLDTDSGLSEYGGEHA